MINMEIAEIQGFHPDSPDQVDHNTEVRADVRATAQRLLGLEGFDKQQHESQIDAITDYAVRECNCEGPKDIIDLIMKLDAHHSNAFKSQYGLMERVHQQVMRHRISKSEKALHQYGNP